jgi:hypothetical protein
MMVKRVAVLVYGVIGYVFFLVDTFLDPIGFVGNLVAPPAGPNTPIAFPTPGPYRVIRHPERSF